MKKIPKIAFSVLIVASGMFIAGRQLINRSIDPPLQLEVPANNVSINKAPVNQAPDDNELNTAASENTSENENYCGNSGVMRILDIGTASPLDKGHPGADSIRLIVVDFDQVQVSILALPVDMWVNTPDQLIADLGPTAPLNQIYLAAYQGSSDASDHISATQTLAQTIVDEFGFIPDQYINVNGESFVELVDSLGGLTITLEGAIDASSENCGLFPEGEQILTGEQTLAFVRMLSPNGLGPNYFGRFERQNMIIHALLDAVMKADNLENLPELIKEARQMIVTDLSIDQANDLACMVEEVDGDAEFFMVDSEMIALDDQGRMIPDMEKIRELISEMEGN